VSVPPSFEPIIFTANPGLSNKELWRGAWGRSVRITRSDWPLLVSEMRRYLLHINIALTVVLLAICATVVRAGKRGNRIEYPPLFCRTHHGLCDCDGNMIKLESS